MKAMCTLEWWVDGIRQRTLLSNQPRSTCKWTAGKLKRQYPAGLMLIRYTVSPQSKNANLFAI